MGAKKGSMASTGHRSRQARHARAAVQLLAGLPPFLTSAAAALRCGSGGAGATEGFFLGDSGLTCCHYDAVTANVVLGTDRGVVHFLDASGLR